MEKAYIAGKLNANNAVDYLKNVSDMMKYAEKVRKKGYSIFVPCLDLLMGIKFGWEDYEDYFNNNLEWVKVSDVIFVCPGSQNSKGTKKEIEVAKQHNIRVEYFL